ncbi:MAG: hypothetical protein HY878_04925 [Deltaproteobacteria bacterium]|nr:hypothetical protein [Deltaproteobacteria bacterium]
MKRPLMNIRIKGEPIKRDVIECAFETIKGSQHPAIYPLAIIRELIKLLSRPDDIVLDPTYEFTDAYVENLKGDKTIKYEHVLRTLYRP